MRYLNLSRELFEGLQALDERLSIESSSSGKLSALSEMLLQPFTTLEEIYRVEMRQDVDTTLRGFEGSRRLLDQAGESDSYERSLVQYNFFALCWAWQNGLDLSQPELFNLVRAAHRAMLGYRLIDLCVDHRKLGAEAIALGSFLIRSHEHLLVDIFGAARALPVVKRYADQYAFAEYLEKSRRWQGCPLASNDAKQTGLKAAPAFSIFHLLFERAGKSEAQVMELADGLCCIFAGIQMSDDFADMADDLANGFETLPSSGFYEWNRGRGIDAVRVAEYFDQRKLRVFVRTTLGLWNSAITIFENERDPILLLLAEQRKHRFLRRWNLGRVASREALPNVVESDRQEKNVNGYQTI